MWYFLISIASFDANARGQQKTFMNEENFVAVFYELPPLSLERL